MEYSPLSPRSYLPPGAGTWYVPITTVPRFATLALRKSAKRLNPLGPVISRSSSPRLVGSTPFVDSYSMRNLNDLPRVTVPRPMKSGESGDPGPIGWVGSGAGETGVTVTRAVYRSSVARASPESTPRLGLSPVLLELSAHAAWNTLFRNDRPR